MRSMADFEQSLVDMNITGDLRLLVRHLFHAHRNESADELTMLDAEDYHWHEHHGPGGLRSHTHDHLMEPVPPAAPAKTTVYVAGVEDRRTGLDVYVFSTAEAAIAHVKAEALDSADGDTSLIDELQLPAYVYFAYYRSDENTVWVQEKVIDDAPSIQ